MVVATWRSIADHEQHATYVEGLEEARSLLEPIAEEFKAYWEEDEQMPTSSDAAAGTAKNDDGAVQPDDVALNGDRPMFESVRYRSQLRQLQRNQKKARKAYRKDLRHARKSGAPGEVIAELEHRDFFEQRVYDEEMEGLQSGYLLNKAHKYILHTPDFDSESSDWKQSDIVGGWRLTLSAQAELRSRIDEYEKMRRERVQSWMTSLTGIITACTGLIGVAIGLIAIL